MLQLLLFFTKSFCHKKKAFVLRTSYLLLLTTTMKKALTNTYPTTLTSIAKTLHLLHLMRYFLRIGFFDLLLMDYVLFDLDSSFLF